MEKLHPRWFVKYAALVVLLLAAVLVAVGPHAGMAQAPGNPNAQSEPPTGPEDSEGEVSVESAGPYMFSMPAGAFSCDGIHCDRTRWSITKGYMYGMDDLGTCVKAPVYVPIGATINGVQVFVDDQRDYMDQWFKLYRISLGTGGINEMASVRTPWGTTSGFKRLNDYSIRYPEVRHGYVYQMFTCAHVNIYVYGVRILYALGAGSAAADEEIDLPIVMDGE